MSCLNRLQGLTIAENRGSGDKKTHESPHGKSVADKSSAHKANIDFVLAQLSNEKQDLTNTKKQKGSVETHGMSLNPTPTPLTVSPAASGESNSQGPLLTSISNNITPSDVDEVMRLRMQLAEAQATINNLQNQQAQPQQSNLPSMGVNGLRDVYDFKQPTPPMANWSQAGQTATHQVDETRQFHQDMPNYWTPRSNYEGNLSANLHTMGPVSNWIPPPPPPLHAPTVSRPFGEYSANILQYPPSSEAQPLISTTNVQAIEPITPDDDNFRRARHDQDILSQRPQTVTPLEATPFGGNGSGILFNGRSKMHSNSYSNFNVPASDALTPFIPGSGPQLNLDHFVVDKIVRNNDQQASIFLQQKLKVGSSQQKFDIVEAIIYQAFPLMINRFGNFLVQRCFEHGTTEQVVRIAQEIRTRTLILSMDPFGCHVIQKAFDCVPEKYKVIMVNELLNRIPETIVHRYACHVWQKLFELRWADTPPQIMKFVNDAICGAWHEVALGETGSLVVQNIFENCLEEDKRPCIEEVLKNINIVAHGQFGNWCIQHICEHGAENDKKRAIDHVLSCAAEYSTDQFASKVVEKCLKIGGPEFIGCYLDRVCEGRPDRPRIPLIDIAGDQYGNYLIQYILVNAPQHFRDLVAGHIRKHMVSLRGSKFGSRVGMICTNPASATRPGPPSGPSVHGNSHRLGGRFNNSSFR
ncbi:hypothetical protein TD95_003055 [Thielaviopsis punctulata]|uniref:PUM-HD domain-containing protein n=1 Tax=Thielaviopsis punctulata TaxID=72032 RepID=A0A0F4ZJ09_9PEZI|nr:hypothetical protein TD95_003055 [Thielaviopsis punctulata]